MPKVTFSPFVTSVATNGKAQLGRLGGEKRSSQRRLSRNRSRRTPLTYDMKKAFAVARRMEMEVHGRNEDHLTRRVNEEIAIDGLLQQNRLYQYTSRLYRLTDTALMMLKKKLLSQMRQGRVVRWFP